MAMVRTNPNFKAEMEALIDQIEDKRRELDPFYIAKVHLMIIVDSTQFYFRTDTKLSYKMPLF